MRFVVQVTDLRGHSEFLGDCDFGNTLTRARRLVGILMNADDACKALHVTIRELCEKCDARGHKVTKGGQKRRCKACRAGERDVPLDLWIWREGCSPEDAARRAREALEAA